MPDTFRVVADSKIIKEGIIDKGEAIRICQTQHVLHGDKIHEVWTVYEKPQVIGGRAYRSMGLYQLKPEDSFPEHEANLLAGQGVTDPDHPCRKCKVSWCNPTRCYKRTDYLKMRHYEKKLEEDEA